MKNLFLLLSLLTAGSTAFSQYWQQRVDYVIEVSLDVKTKTLDGFEKIAYTNHSPDTLHYLWFHLWPNAYKNDRTALTDQLLTNGKTALYFASKEQRGYINRLDFKADGVTARTEDHPEHIDVVKLILPKPLPPGGKVNITTPFHVKLPFNFSRGGYSGETFQITQWYPKPAVYDRKGWHPMPYLDQGEFYSEFGSFDVRITLPRDYVVAATGELQNEAEKLWLKGRKQSDSRPQKKPAPVSKPGVPKPKAPPRDTITKTLVYKQDNVHDFAWFANRDFIVESDTCILPSGRSVEVYAFFTPEEAKQWSKAVSYAKDATRFYSTEVGEYPYATVSIVQGPESFGGGMEYPTITVIAPAESAKTLDMVIAHEVGHNWFQGVLASNERDHPWLDEGINSFYEHRYMKAKYGQWSRGNELLFMTKAKRLTDQPISTPSEALSEFNYGLVTYEKTANWMEGLEKKWGEEVLRSAIRRYYKQWRFRHPYPEDLKAVLGQFSTDTAAAFAQLDSTGLLPHQEPMGFSFVSPFKRGSIKNYLQSPSRNIIALFPALGSNSYDRTMLGILLTNYKLPPTNFNFLVAPMYATGSKSLVGLGRLNYSIHRKGLIRKTDLFVNASKFSMDQFKDTAGRKLTMQFWKLAPGLRVTLNEKDPKSQVRRYLQWKTFLIGEQSLRISRDTVISGTDTALILRYGLPRQDRYLNQLRLVYENNRALYPFRFHLQVEQASDFIRPALTANYFFNYPDQGGLQLRFFAGKFIYLNGKTIRKQFENDRYHLNMTGANGYEDYTYSTYFFGRNEFEGLESQQIMMRDGGFKVRTDLLASKIGKTDNWLAAINLHSSLPDKINPLSVLPVKIPLGVFFDIGTYAEAWEKDAEGDRFLYDMGLHIPLLDEAVNIFIPVFYNKVYGDYFKSTIPKNRFFKTISFTIDLYPKSLRALNRELEF
ncbi:MAG TPA: M1 family metallopeptidase [Flavisolibacter sp.]|nr:M1 family metallopeptidase [Flavisolibacter sp.]